MKLTKIEKNYLFDRIVNAGLSPNNFYFTSKQSIYKKGLIEKLKVKGHDYYFIFDYFRSEGRLDYAFTFNPHINKGKERYYKARTWGEVLKSFNTWLNLIKYELIGPDKWKEYQQRISNIKFRIDNKDNSSFTYSEIELINSSIGELKTKISQLNLKSSDIKLLNDKLDYLVEKSKTMGRVDWKELFLGAIIGKIIELSIPPDVANTMWLFIGQTLKSIFVLALSQ